ncbi:MAG: transglutaminase family protein [Candidatus Korobacteraceae bacterium]
MIYSAIHITRQLYQSPVSQSLNELRLTPRSLPGQQVRQVNISIEPEPATWQSRKDYFGNEVITVGVYEPHGRLVIEAKSVVEVEAPSLDALSPMSWEQARDLIAAHPDDESLAALEFVYDSPFIAAADELAEYARPSFPPGRPLAEALLELSHRIYTEFKYKPNSTSIEMPLLEVLGNRQGVCQDFAHVMIGALRSLRLPARYTSGYLRSSPGSHGAEASHAWVAAFVPGSGWLSYDPTNDVMPTDRHLTLAWGRDYGDVTPVKGVAVGGGSHSVEVEVMVKAMESNETAGPVAD